MKKQVQLGKTNMHRCMDDQGYEIQLAFSGQRLDGFLLHQHSYGFGKLIPEPKQKTSPQSGS